MTLRAVASNIASISGGTISGATITVADNAFTIQDNADPTKQAQFQASGITTGTTRTFTLPDANATLARTDAAQTFTGTQTFGAVVGTTGTFTGAVSGLTLEVFKTASADSPLTAAQVASTIVSNFGMTDADCTIALPTAVAGYSFVAILPAVRAHFFKFQAAASDKIYLLGVAGSDNGNVGVASGYATSVSCSFYTFKASDGGYDWFALPIFGTWVAS